MSSKISQLGRLSTPVNQDQIPIVNGDTTKKILFGDLGAGVRNLNTPLTASEIQVNGDVNIDGNLTISTLISSSTLYSSGSTIFGNTVDDTHQFTGSIFITGSIEDVEYIDFELTNNVVPQTGRLWWDPTNGTLDIGVTDEVVVSLGEELIYPYVVNGDTVDLPLGALVMVDPDDVAQGQRLRVVRAVTDGSYRSDLIVGVTAQVIEQNQQGYVTWFGQVREVPINLLEQAGLKDDQESWVEGDILYPDPDRPGGLTKVPPIAPNLKSTIAVLTTVNGNNANYLVRPSLGPRISDINNVRQTEKVQGELIVFNSGSNYWDTTTQLSGSYSITGSLDVTNTVNVGTVLNLSPSDPLPGGNIGDLAVSGSNLFFYNGSWTQVV